MKIHRGLIVGTIHFLPNRGKGNTQRAYMQAIYQGSVESVAAKQSKREQTVERAGIGSACFFDRLYDIVALTDNRSCNVYLPGGDEYEFLSRNNRFGEVFSIVWIKCLKRERRRKKRSKRNSWRKIIWSKDMFPVHVESIH